MYIVMAAVDELVTLLDGQLPSKWFSYTPLPSFSEVDDWRAGMVHEPAHRAEWERLQNLLRLAEVNAAPPLLRQGAHCRARPLRHQLPATLAQLPPL